MTVIERAKCMSTLLFQKLARLKKYRSSLYNIGKDWKVYQYSSENGSGNSTKAHGYIVLHAVCPACRAVRCLILDFQPPDTK